MSNYDYEDEDDITQDDSPNDLVKQLRKAAKAKDKELQELKSQFESLNKAQRDRAIKDALASRGVNSKIASFIPQDIDPTEESVSKWLEDYRMTNSADSGASPEHNGDIMQRLMNANSKEELDEVIRLSGL